MSKSYPRRAELASIIKSRFEDKTISKELLQEWVEEFYLKLNGLKPNKHEPNEVTGFNGFVFVVVVFNDISFHELHLSD